MNIGLPACWEAVFRGGSRNTGSCYNVNRTSAYWLSLYFNTITVSQYLNETSAGTRASAGSYGFPVIPEKYS